MKIEVSQDISRSVRMHMIYNCFCQIEIEIGCLASKSKKYEIVAKQSKVKAKMIWLISLGLISDKLKTLRLAVSLFFNYFFQIRF